MFVPHSSDIFVMDVKRINECLQLNSYLVKEKLPQETNNLEKELGIMQTIAAERHPTRSDLLAVQDKVNI